MNDAPRSTRALQALLNQRGQGPSLNIASHEGALARTLGCTYISADLVACEKASASGVGAVLHSDQVPAGPWATVFFDAREYDPGLAAETVAQVARRLDPRGVLLTTARKADVEACFASVVEQGEALVARSPLADLPEVDWPVYTAQFGGRTFGIQSGPGVFSPRRLDEGTAFMLAQVEAPTPGARFLDLGCGTGVVSRIAADAWGCQVTSVDVNARALRLTSTNAPGAEVIASNGFAGLRGREFDMITSNPPYHTDFGVARAFIEGAYAHLAMGGMLYLVIKRADWYVQKVRSVFGGCKVVEQGGYTVIITQKRPPKPKAEPPAATTTRKHAKRMASSHKKHR